MEVDFTYPKAANYMLRRRVGLALRALKIRPPEVRSPIISQRVSELNQAIANGTIERPYAYNDDGMTTFKDYADGRLSSDQDHTFYPRLFYRAIRDTLAHDPEVKTAINFGCMFANVDATLALHYPAVSFLGVDMGASIKKANEAFFAGKNLTFIDSAIELVVAAPGHARPSLLAHCKTATICYPAKIEQLYNLAAQEGVRYIVGVENTGFCWETEKFYEFTTTPKKSVFYKSVCFVHNYPALLEQAGYRVTSGQVAYDGLNYAIVFVGSLR